jgi:hypothetical protein
MMHVVGHSHQKSQQGSDGNARPYFLWDRAIDEETFRQILQ